MSAGEILQFVKGVLGDKCFIFMYLWRRVGNFCCSNTCGNCCDKVLDQTRVQEVKKAMPTIPFYLMVLMVFFGIVLPVHSLVIIIPVSWNVVVSVRNCILT